MITIDEREIRSGEDTIPSTLYRSDDDGGTIVILAPGAGAPRAHPFMVVVAEAIARRGVHVLTFDFAYMAAGKRAPDRLPKLAATYRSVLDDTRERLGGTVVLAGKSMGSRVACTVAAAAHAEGMHDVVGVVSLGYPLAPKDRPKERAPREALLVATPLPHLVVQGARDAFGGAEVFPEVIANARGRGAELVLVPDADHGFEMPKRTRGERTREDVWAELAIPIVAFVRARAAAIG